MPKKNYILLTGVEFNNQGAYLMLRAAADMIRTEFDGIPVVEFHNGSDENKRVAGVYPLVPQRTLGLFRRLRRIRLLKKLWGRFPLILPTQITAVFDGSGFLYGDQWAHRDLDYTAGKLRGWSAQGVPVYLLPQALGPFTKTGSPSLKALRSARIVFARDPESERYAAGLLGSAPAPTLRRSPDFTATLSGSFPASAEAFRGRVPIIANTNIYDRAGSPEKQNRYLENVAAIIEQLHAKGLSPYLLAHEGRRDVTLLDRISDTVEQRSGLQLPLVQGLNGLQLKGLIATAPLIVSGRYHAIVSALSQGVPAIIHGWSHKYQYVAEDFGVPELLCDPLGAVEDGVAVVDAILADDKLPDRLTRASAEVKDQIATMWDVIRDDLAIAGRTPTPSASR